jgi:hypothetical protein
MFGKILLGFVVVVAFAGCQENGKSDKPDNAISPSVVENPATASSDDSEKKFPVIKFEKEVHDFGKIIDGEKVSFAFNFVNTGNADLVIRSANGSCGCTVPDFPKDPVKPGENGIINVTFDSNGRAGHQEKEVTIISNTIPSTMKVKIVATVEKQ